MLAGWLFADLFLAIMIVGLASIPKPAPPPSQSNLSCDPLLYRFAKSDLSDEYRFATEFNKVVDDTVKSRRLVDAKPGIVLLFGGYDQVESVADGQVRAQEIEPKLRNASKRLSKIAIRKLGSRKVDGKEIGGRDEFGLLIYFVYNGPDSLGRCK